MELEDYDKAIKEVENKIERLLINLDIKLSVIRFVSFQSLKLSNTMPFRFVGAETYASLNNEGEPTGYEQRTKIQICYLGKNKLSKMSVIEIQDKLTSLKKLEQLYFQYKHLTATYEAKVEEEYADFRMLQQTRSIKPDETEKIFCGIKADISLMKKIGKYSRRINDFKDKMNLHFTNTGEYLKI